MARILLQRALAQAPRASLASSPRALALGIHGLRALRAASTAPNIGQASFWKSLIPKPLRRDGSAGSPGSAAKKARSAEWNPATFFIVIFLLIGSMSINMIMLKKDFAAFTRRADVRIGLLRETVEKIQRGEKVDVEKALGTGDAEREAEWEEALREIERDDGMRSQKKQDKAKQTAQGTGKQTPASSPEIKLAESTPGAANATPSTASFF